jgi:hypothetical protein
MSISKLKKTKSIFLILFLVMPHWAQDQSPIALGSEPQAALVKVNDSLQNVYLQCQIEHAKLNRSFSMLKTLSRDFQLKKDSIIQSLTIANETISAKQLKQDSLLQVESQDKMFYKEVSLWQWPIGVLLFGLGYSLGSAVLP